MAAPKVNKQQVVDDIDVKVGMNFRQLRKSKPSKEEKIFRLMQKIIKLREQTGQILQEFKKSFKPIKPDLTAVKRKPHKRIPLGNAGFMVKESSVGLRSRPAVTIDIDPSKIRHISIKATR